MIHTHEHVGLDLLAELRSAVLAREKTVPSFRSMNVGGWRSDEAFFAWDVPAVRALRDLIVQLADVGSRTLVGWAVVNRYGTYHKRHNHLGVTSGIYYVTESKTPTIFETPWGAAPYEFTIRPRPGTLAIFPSSTWHRVPACLAEPERITIGFDVR